jgi:ParB-like nuclease domain
MATKESSLVLQDISLDCLVPNENNTNEMSDSEFKRLVAEITESGFLDPLNVIPLADSRFFILGGEHRWRAATQVGLTFVPCIIHSDDRFTDMDQVDLQSFKLNALHGKINSEKFVNLYKRLCERMGADKVRDALSVVDNVEWKRLTKSIQQSLKESGASQEVLDEVKEAEKKSRNPDQLAKKLNKILKDHADSISDHVLLFQYGNKEHVLIRASEDVFIAVAKIIAYANKSNTDVNLVLSKPLSEFVKTLES